MRKPTSKVTAIIAGTAAAGLSGVAIAGAADSGSSSTSTTATTQQPPGGRGAGEKALTGETKKKVEAAALAKVPGTVIRTETDSGGVYESHIRKSDGTEVEVKVGKDFKVTSVEERPAGGRGPGGPGGRGGMHADLAAVAKDLGVTENKLRSAVEAARPEKPADGSKSQRSEEDHEARETAMYAAIAKALGKDADAVEKAFEANRPTKPATP